MNKDKIDKLIAKILPKQRSIRKLGAIKNLFTRTGFYISLLNFLMLSATAYQIVIKEYFSLSYVIFLFILCTIVLGAMGFEWWIMLPSETAFGNWQTYEHQNPWRKDLEEVQENLRIVMEELGLKYKKK